MSIAASAAANEQFDLALANALYRALLGPAEGVLKRKHNLLVVPTGALTALPFQLLVTAPPVWHRATSPTIATPPGW